MPRGNRKTAATDEIERLSEVIDDCDRWGLVLEAQHLRAQYRDMLVASLAQEAGASRVARPTPPAEVAASDLY